MKTKLTVSLLAAVCALALGAQAQDAGGPPPDGGPGGQSGPGGPGMGHHRPLPAIVAALDVNHDGIIDSNEIANASAELKTLDKNGDGQLTMDEVMGPRPHRPGGDQSASVGQGTNESSGPPGAEQGGPGGGHRPPMLPLVSALDANHDGVIDADEIANAPAALKTLDKNGDGQLTRDEYLPPHPHRGPGGPGGQGGQDGPPPGGGDQGGNDAPPGPPPGNDGNN